MNITYQSAFRSGEDWNPKECSVSEFVDRGLTRNDDNQLMQALDNAYSTQLALGKLVEILTDKNILSLENILYIAGRDDSVHRGWREEQQQNHELKP